MLPFAYVSSNYLRDPRQKRINTFNVSIIVNSEAELSGHVKIRSMLGKKSDVRALAIINVSLKILKDCSVIAGSTVSWVSEDDLIKDQREDSPYRDLG